MRYFLRESRTAAPIGPFEVAGIRDGIADGRFRGDGLASISLGETAEQLQCHRKADWFPAGGIPDVQDLLSPRRKLRGAPRPVTGWDAAFNLAGGALLLGIGLSRSRWLPTGVGTLLLALGVVLAWRVLRRRARQASAPQPG